MPGTLGHSGSVGLAAVSPIPHWTRPSYLRTFVCLWPLMFIPHFAFAIPHWTRPSYLRTLLQFISHFAFAIPHWTRPSYIRTLLALIIPHSEFRNPHLAKQIINA